jgi:hypothetical protein
MAICCAGVQSDRLVGPAAGDARIVPFRGNWYELSGPVTGAVRGNVFTRATVDLPIPRFRATCRCGTPSATSRRINAQSSTEITHPICMGGLDFERRHGLTFERRRQAA